MNSENGKTSQPNFTDEIDLGRGEKSIVLSNQIFLIFTILGKT